MPKRTPSLVQLQNVTEGGSFDQGEKVFFDGMTTDGNAVRITVPTDSMGLFIQQLQTFTALAQDDRGDRAASPGESAPVSMMTVKGLGIHASADGTIVAIRVHMGKGIHVDVPLPIEQIDQIIASIQARAAEARKILKTTGH